MELGGILHCVQDEVNVAYSVSPFLGSPAGGAVTAALAVTEGV